MNIRSAFRYLSLASLLTSAASSKAQSLADSASLDPVPLRFPDFLNRIAATRDKQAKLEMVNTFVENLRARGRLPIEDSTVYFMYAGKARRVCLASDLNGWSAASDTMKRLAGTDFFYLPVTIDPAARFEYKLVVDSAWILDPINQQQAFGGYGPNSEIWMPRYSPPQEIAYRSGIAHGTIDTMVFTSKVLGRTHPVYIYLPQRYRASRKSYPSIYVTDGGEYISLALMLNVLDNLIAGKRIPPIIGVFIDPRTDGKSAGTSTRMKDYAMSDSFVNALANELRSRLTKKYRISSDASQTAIMGASLGGLIATYAALTRPDVFGLCAAQSPAYWFKDSSIFTIAREGHRKDVRFYIDTGTIRDARPDAVRMRDLLVSKGHEVHYGEYPESHNWGNWRARISTILTYFWGTNR